MTTPSTAVHPARSYARDHRISWRGITFPCRTVGPQDLAPERTLLVLSGGLQDRHSWARLERHLSPHHRLLIPDLPPALSPDTGDSALGWDDLTDATLRTADQLGAERLAVLAVSSGYPIGYRLAQRHPDRVTRLMLFGVSPRPGPRLTTLIHEGLRRQRAPLQQASDTEARRTAAEQLVAVLTNTQAAEQHPLMKAAARVVRNQLTAASQDPLVRYVADRGALLLQDPLPAGGICGVPALVGVGEFDTTTTVADNRAVASTIAGAAFVVVHGCDHLLHMERDADYAALIARFMRDGATGSPPLGTTEPLI